MGLLMPEDALAQSFTDFSLILQSLHHLLQHAAEPATADLGMRFKMRLGHTDPRMDGA